MVTHTVVFASALDTSTLFGPYDAHLRQVETTLGVEISGRGHALQVTGPTAAADAARRVLEGLSERQQSQGMVDVADLRLLLARETDDAGATPPADGSPPSPTDAVPELTITGPAGRVVPRNRTQEDYLAAMAQHDLVVAIGPAGTGKTYLAMAAAVSAYNQKQVRRIILTRPAVEAGERLGFLPGDMIEKIDPYLRPLYDALYDLMPGDTVRRLLEKGIIEIAPLAFMRGRTLNDAFIILDEAQNTTSPQMKMFLTRFGSQAKVVVTGDRTQIDLPAGEISGLCEIETVLADIPGVAFLRFKAGDVVRHPLVARIVEAYAALENGDRGSD